MAYVAPTTRSAGDAVTAADYNIMANSVIAMRATAVNVVTTLLTSTLAVSLGSTGGTAALTGLTVNITPTSSSSKILILASVNGMEPTSGTFLFLRRNATAIMIGDAAGVRQRVTSATAAAPTMHGLIYLDSPATTSSVTYDVAAMSGGAPARTIYINREDVYTNATNYFTSTSSITVMEIPA